MCSCGHGGLCLCGCVGRGLDGACVTWVGVGGL